MAARMESKMCPKIGEKFNEQQLKQWMEQYMTKWIKRRKQYYVEKNWLHLQKPVLKDECKTE